jgi:serine protease AprX
MKKNTVKGFMLLALGLGTGLTAFAQTPEQRAEIVKTYDLDKIQALEQKLKLQHDENYRKALELAQVNGWPLRFVEDGRVSVLSGITKDNFPLYKTTDNAGAATTARVDAIRSGGSLGLDLNGQNMIMGIWEIGDVRTTHVDLAGRVTVRDDSHFDSSSEESIHATHVAGTMIGSGNGNINARGLAYQASLWSYNSTSDDSEALSAARQGLLISNHSYGLRRSSAPSWMPGAYSQEAVIWDEVMAAAPYYQAVISAGNDRSGEERDLLLGNKTSKNAIIVAAVNQVLNYTGPNSVVMSGFSSYGPTDDKRIKPDISMKGVGVLSTSGSGDRSYIEEQGTSMASPGVAGTLILLQQHFRNLYPNFMKAATLRGLMIHTADEAGTNPGPDFRFGWGLINATKAVQLISGRGRTSIIDELSLNNRATYTRQVTASGAGPLKVTLVWTDPAGQENDGVPNSTTPVLVNDLDVRVTKDDQTYFPWKLNNIVNLAAQRADNALDNVEVIDVTPAAGVYTITVTHKGILKDFRAQDFSLIIDGVTDTNGIASNELGAKIGVYPNPATDVINISMDASLDVNNTSIQLYDIQGRLVKQSGTFVDKIDVSDLSAGMYMLNITKDGAIASKKIIIE